MPGSASLRDCKILEEMVKKQVESGRINAAIYAASAVALGSWCLLKGLKATCYPSFMEKLPADVTKVESRVQVDGKAVTRWGAGTTVGFGLALIELLYGKEKAEEVAGPMIVEFIAVLLGTGDEAAEKELINSRAIQRILDLFYEYPFNNSLNHHVESIITACLDSKNNAIIDHLFQVCNIIEKFLQADKDPSLSSDSNLLTKPAAGRQPPRAGYIGHITRIANKLVQVGNCNDHIQRHLQDPRQPFGSILCGYYSLRFMRHLMKDSLKLLKLKMKKLKYMAYGNDDMHEVQFEFFEIDSTICC